MFNIFKKQKKSVDILAPFDGTLMPLSSSPDAAFAEGMLGEGVCIDPTSSVVCAPLDCYVDIFPTLHAAGCKTDDFELIVHVGIDTVKMEGAGFKALGALTRQVKAGDPLVEFDKDFLSSKVDSLITPVVIPDKPDGAVITIPKTEGTVKQGDVIFTITW